MKVGVLELQAYGANSLWQHLEYFWLNKQYVSITTQAVSVWCRQLSHQVYYATYAGVGDPQKKLPPELDVVFVSTHTVTAPLAYALSKLYKNEGARTVVGGPHAKSFPDDCLRYFDLVVLECDKELVADIISDQFPSKTIVSSQFPYDEPPSIEERLPEIQGSVFLRGRPYPGSFIPMITSTGCPYSCNFCSDWNNPYRLFSLDRLALDLRFIAKTFPQVHLIFHDPNFGVNFDEVMEIFENFSPDQRVRYGIQSTLANLNLDRLKRLRDSNCIFIIPSIESWTTMYSNKLGVGGKVGLEKLAQLVETFHLLRDYIPYYLSTNFIFGLDFDSGTEPFELTKEFLLHTPFVWPVLNIPLPFGGTPMFDTFLQEGRILEVLPFTFYTAPYITIIFKNYDPITYVRNMVDLFSIATSDELLKRRFECSPNLQMKGVYYLRTRIIRRYYRFLQKTLERLFSDSDYLAFHNGQTKILPVYYRDIYYQSMGHYAELMPIEEVCWPLLSREETVNICRK